MWFLIWLTRELSIDEVNSYFANDKDRVATVKWFSGSDMRGRSASNPPDWWEETWFPPEYHDTRLNHIPYTTVIKLSNSLLLEVELLANSLKCGS